ncbi:MAG: purine-nucleoside phosphorylase [Chthoniobacterales bacterium]|nr:purine-nucleoside phosphorylase [Chthoniobacterales bacterium]
MDNFAIERVREYGAQIALVLGSGLSSLVQDPARDHVIPYSEIGGLPRSTVKGHIGRFLLDEIGGQRVVFAQGRVHLYEGHRASDVTAGIRFLARAGITKLILTNAAGSVNPDFAPGSWMMITDHLNLTGTTPLLGKAGFIDLTDAYSPAWRTRFAAAARAKNLRLHEGIYAGMLGPQYETPGEVKMLRHLGADAIGMSTVCETIQARALGLEVAGFSCLTNWAAGLNPQPLSHAEVLSAGKASSEALRLLLESAIDGTCSPLV